MQITVNTSALAVELRLLNQVAPAKHALPVLMNVLITANGALQLAATDLEIALATACPAQVMQAGRVLLPAKKLLDIVEQLPSGGEINIATDGPYVHIASGAFRGRLQAMPAEEFPVLPPMTGGGAGLPRAALQAAIGRVRYAVTDKGKYTVNGALFLETEKAAAIVATDGKRLALSSLPLSGAAASVIFPLKLLDALMGLGGEAVVFSQGERHLFFQADGRLLTSRMLEGAFPAYERIIPRGCDRRATVDRAALAAALRRVGQVSEENMACYLGFSAEGLDVASQSAGIGEAAERVPIAYAGEALRVCCSWRFLLDFLEVAAGQTVEVELTSNTAPMLLTDGVGHLAVLMLMKG